MDFSNFWWGIFYEIAQIWMSLDLTDDQSTLVQVMAWCYQTTSHNLSHMTSLGHNELTLLPLDKMASILANHIFTWIFLNENDRIPIQISQRFVPRSPLDNKLALVQVMARHRTGHKPLSEPMMTQFTDAYIYIYIYVIPHPVASEHRWLVKAPRWIHSVPDVSGRRLWRRGYHARLWNLHDITNTSRL